MAAEGEAVSPLIERVRKAWDALLGREEPAQADPHLAYQCGFQNGITVGEYRGRKAVLDELEVRLAGTAHTIEEVDMDDVALAKSRMRH